MKKIILFLVIVSSYLAKAQKNRTDLSGGAPIRLGYCGVKDIARWGFGCFICRSASKDLGYKKILVT